MTLQKRLDAIEKRKRPDKPHRRVICRYDDETEAQARVREGVSPTGPVEVIHFVTVSSNSVEAANMDQLKNISFKGTMPKQRGVAA